MSIFKYQKLDILIRLIKKTRKDFKHSDNNFYYNFIANLFYFNIFIILYQNRQSSIA